MTTTLSILEQVTADVAVLRKTFREGKTRPLESRRASLLALQRLIVEGTPLLCAAVWKDLHKPEFETAAGELALVKSDIQEHLDHLEEWAAPQPVSTDKLNIPGSSAIWSDPLGVCCVMGPWNYPVGLTLKPLVGCLAAGNTCLLRVPSDDQCSESSKVIAKLVREYMDPNVVRVVEGGIPATQAVLAMAPHLDKYFFTGGSFVGKLVAKAAAEHLVPTVLELGGKSPCIVDQSADITIAGKRVAWGAFFNAGQTCVRPDYVLVHTSIADRFIQAVQDGRTHMYGKGPESNRSSPDYGRIVNIRSHQRLAQFIASAASTGCTMTGGDCNEDELFIEPTILDFGTDWKAFADAAVMQQEIFGPIMPILRYDSLDEALEFIQKRPKPLALYCFTTTTSVHQRVLKETTSGMAVINDCMVQVSNSALPFGGVGASGMGSYGGKKSFDAFSHQKSVLYKTNWLDVPMRYPPYSEFSKKVMLALLVPIPRQQMRWLQLSVVVLGLSIASVYVDWQATPLGAYLGL